MQEVIQQLEDAGLIMDGPLVFDVLTRCKAEGDKGRKQSGWYVVHEITLRAGKVVMVGRYGNWKRYGGESLKIDFDLPPLTDEEKKEFADRQDAQRKQIEVEKKKRAADAAKRAATIWGGLPTEGGSPYLDRKKSRCFGIRFSRGSIVIPARDIAGALAGLQFIGPDGDKKFLTGTAKRGCFHLIGDHAEYPLDAPLAIVEGYATGTSVHLATSWKVAVAFDAGNLLPVALALRAAFPEQPMIICADNDVETEGNPGVTKATEAAMAVGAHLAVPEFPAGSHGLTDFNDLHTGLSAEEPRRDIRTSIVGSKTGVIKEDYRVVSKQ